MACNVVRTDAGLSESFEVKVGLHQGSVLSPLLFAAVMDVVSSETRSGLPSELMYADNLVLMAPTMEQLGRRVASLLDKELKVNAGKSKVMVGISAGKLIVNSGKWPCGVCGKGVQANSVQCTVYKNEFTRGVCGDLSWVTDGFKCRQCDGTARSRNGWMKFQDLLPFLPSRVPSLEMKGRVYASCVRSSMTYGSETRPLLVDVGLKFERADMQMIRWMCGISMKDRRTNEELRWTVGVEPITAVIRRGKDM